ncbi:MAG: hypothetical protein ABIQ35_14135, partial [Verrucomicrobiota bacterium]
MKTVRRLSFGLLVFALTVIIWQRAELGSLRNSSSTLRDSTAEFNRLRSENERLSKFEADSVDLARLREEHSELLRLRGETARLRQLLKSQAANAKPRDGNSTPVVKPPVETIAANVEAELAPRQTLVMGGWPAGDGKRTFLLVEPVLIDAAGNEIPSNQAKENAATTQVLLQSQFAEVPEQFLQDLGLKNVAADG